MYKIGDSSIITGYIKEILHNFNLPSFRVYRNDLTFQEGKQYIIDKGIYTYTNGEFTQVGPFYYNKNILNCTTTLNLSSTIYDINTHEYLGNYLRFMRDYNQLNLMPLYNCFSGAEPIDINENVPLDDLDESDVNKKYFKFFTDDDNYYYYITPIKFDEEYTIAIDSVSSYEVCCMLYTDNELSDLCKELIKETYKKIPGSSFKTPYLFSTKFNYSDYWKYEKCLKLIFKLPKSIESSIVVLEGNYLCNSTTVGNFLSVKENPIQIKTADGKSAPNISINPPTKLSLLSINDTNTYAFADRLVEYLLGGAITHGDFIENDIGRLQNDLQKTWGIFKGYYGIWDNYIRQGIHDFAFTETDTKNNYDEINTESSEGYTYLRPVDKYNDLLYYGDKDMEWGLSINANS